MNEDPTAILAANLKRLRATHGWSLDELAERSGVSRAMLHQVESGRSTPTVAVLWRIAAGLEVSAASLVEEATGGGPVLLAHAQAKLLSNADGSFSTRALFPFDGRRHAAEFYEVRIAPGGCERAEAHEPGTREHLVLAAGGTASVEVDGRRIALQPHDAVVFAADVPHIYRNDDRKREALLYLMITCRA